MEVESSPLLEMDEMLPKVYDIFHSTPIPLKNLSAVATGTEMWRYTINKRRTSDTFDESVRWPSRERVSLKTVLPDLPSTIHDMIDKFTTAFGWALEDWLEYHYNKIFKFHYSNKNQILNDFDEFAGAFDTENVEEYNAIDHVRTAERMMRSGRLSENVKFKVACMYCFEDDIRRIWPSIRDTICVDLNHTIFLESPPFYYWIASLTNQLDKIAVLGNTYIVYETMLWNWISPDNKSSVEYYWNRIPSESCLEKAVKVFNYDIECFVRCILPKLDFPELQLFLNKHGSTMLHTLLHDYTEHFTPTWMYVRDAMDEISFTELLKEIFLADNYDPAGVAGEAWVDGFRELWNSTPDNFKRSAVTFFISDVESFRYMDSIWCFVKFLLIMLPNTTTFDERSAFWRDRWLDLITNARSEDRQQMMQICFKNEGEIAEFKRNVMAGDADARQECVIYMYRGMFEDLNDLVDFCHPDTETAKHYKQELLKSVVLSEEGEISHMLVFNSKQFHDFISSLYHSADMLMDFKIQLASSPALRRLISEYTLRRQAVPLFEFMEFIGVFAPSEQSLQQTKTRVIESLKVNLTENRATCDIFMMTDFDKYLLWCLGSTEQVEEFKRTYL